MDMLGGNNPTEEALKGFRECLSKYKHEFNRITTTDENKQDTADANEVIRLIDDLYMRLYHILQQFAAGTPPPRPTQDKPLEYTFFTDGRLEHLYKDSTSIKRFKEYLYTDLKTFPFTYDVGIIESYRGVPVQPPMIVSNRQDKSKNV